MVGVGWGRDWAQSASVSRDTVVPAFLCPPPRMKLLLSVKSALLLAEGRPLSQVEYCVLGPAFRCICEVDGLDQGQGEGSQDLMKQVAG